MRIQTASWFTKLPDKITLISISRSAPRGQANFRSFADFKPGPWFKTVEPSEFLRLYTEILDRLDPHQALSRLASYGDHPVLLCWEPADDCCAGKKWCHRHLAAQWLEDRLDIKVPEVGFTKFDRFALLRKAGIPLPDFRVRKRKKR